ncbi:MAG: hypothetical protein H7Y03_11620 [Chitinophagaceae bacterium]|nr:hypothetical protein [Chitinophagaceae bacterium]
MEATIYKRKRVFSIGEKSSVLAKLSAALENSGFSTKWSNKSSNVNALVQDFHGNHFDLVLFGRGIKPENKKLITQRFRSQNEQLIFIDALAPLSELMVDQVKLAFVQEAGKMPCIVHTDSKALSIEILEDCQLQVRSYEQKWLARTSENLLLSARLQGGTFSVPLKPSSGKQFLVVSVDDVVIFIKEIV